MAVSPIDPNDFCRPGTRRVESFGASACAPLVAAAGGDGQIYVWDVHSKTRVSTFNTTQDSGGVSVAMSPDGQTCFVGTYYAWGVAAFAIPDARRRWQRVDLKRVYGIACVNQQSIVTWFDGRAGLTLDTETGESRERHVGLRHFGGSRFDGSTLKFARRFALHSSAGEVHTWAGTSFAVLAVAFSPTTCAISESAGPLRAFDSITGRALWEYRSRPGAHVTQLDYCPRIGAFVALEYAYSEAAREAGPMMELLHVDASGRVPFRSAVRGWSNAIFCADGELLLNGLGELFDVTTGELTHVFDFPR